MSLSPDSNESLTDPTLVDGRYRLDVELGAGAFGSVYKAAQVVMDQDMRDVALKLFHRNALKSGSVREMMNDALQILSLLSGLADWEIRQHFVTVYDLGVTRETKPRGFVAMELVRGGSLEGRIRDLGKFTVPGTLHYLHQIVRAMAFMHAREFVHSDLKPANILVYRGQQNDLIKIADFGLSGKYVGPFAAGPRGGTMSYMAPEALAGFATTPGCDVFSLGVMAYEMLTGRNPYNQAGRTLDSQAPDYNQQLNRVQQMSRDVPLRLELDDFPELSAPGSKLASLAPLLDVINKMLATQFTQRYASAQDVYRDLERIMAGRPPTLALDQPGNPQSAAASSAGAPAQQLLESLIETFNYQLARGDWAESMRAAGQVLRVARDRAIGYQLRARLAREQAKRLPGDAAAAAAVKRMREQAISWLNRGLSACSAKSEQEKLRHDLADVYQETGDHATAQQIRNLGA